jgi:hypothetical protein
MAVAATPWLPFSEAASAHPSKFAIHGRVGRGGHGRVGRGGHGAHEPPSRHRRPRQREALGPMRGGHQSEGTRRQCRRFCSARYGSAGCTADPMHSRSNMVQGCPGHQGGHRPSPAPGRRLAGGDVAAGPAFMQHSGDRVSPEFPRLPCLGHMTFNTLVQVTPH